MLERDTVCPLGNVQQRGGFGGRLYGRREEEIIWKAGAQNFRGGYPNRENQYRRTETELGPMAVNEEERRGGY